MKTCFNCGKNGIDLYGYTICDPCKTKLRLFTPEIIKKYNSKNLEGFSKEIERRLDYLDKEYVKKRIKLLHILDQLKSF